MFSYVPDKVVKGLTWPLITVGKQAQGLQEFERKKLQIEGSDSLMDMNSDQLSNYINQMYQTSNEDLSFLNRSSILSAKLTLELNFNNLPSMLAEDDVFKERIKEVTEQTLAEKYQASFVGFGGNRW